MKVNTMSESPVNTNRKKSFNFVAANLKAIRGEASQADFAKVLGIANQVTYHRYESGRVPKAEILHELSERLGISLEELLSPISPMRAAVIYTQATIKQMLPEANDSKLSEASAKAFGEASGELITDESIKAITKAMQLERASHDEISRLFKHVIAVANKTPPELMKYFVLIRYAVMLQIARHHKLDYKPTKK